MTIGVLTTRTHPVRIGQLGDVDEVVRHECGLSVVARDVDRTGPSSEPLSGAGALRAVLTSYAHRQGQWRRSWLGRKTLSSSPSSRVTLHPQRIRHWRCVMSGTRGSPGTSQCQALTVPMLSMSAHPVGVWYLHSMGAL